MALIATRTLAPLYLPMDSLQWYKFIGILQTVLTGIISINVHIIYKLCCCILRGPGGERIVDVVPGGTELEPQVKKGSWAGHTHTHAIIPYWSLLRINSE